MTSWRLILRRRRDARGRTVHTRRTAEAVRALIDAANAASAPRIADLLSAGAALTIDVGARTLTSAAPVPGASATAVELLSLLDRFPDRMLVQHEVNGSAGIVVQAHDRVVGVISLSMRASTITHIWVVANPDKLAHWNRT